MNKLIRVALVALMLAVRLPGLAQSVAEETAQQIKSEPQRYYWGEGAGESLDEARQSALAALSQSIQAVVWTDVYGEENNMGATISAKSGISSFTTLANTECIEFPFDEKNGVYRVMIYVERAELLRMAQARADKIREWIENGRLQESRLEVSNALKYYYWALSLSDVHSASLKIDVDGSKKEAKPWLESKIANLLNSINVELDNVEERPGDANPYLVNLNFTCQGQKVNGLELSYFTGLRQVSGIYAKNGVATLEFPKLPKDNIDLTYEYAFASEGALFDPELEAYFEANPKRVFAQAKHKVRMNGLSAGPSVPDRRQEPALVQATAKDGGAVVAEVEIAKPRKRVETKESADPDKFASTMRSIISAISTKNYESVRSLFTDDGYNTFTRMMQSGEVKLSRSDVTDFMVEQAEGYTIGKRIPVQITYPGRKKCNEDIVVRFRNDGLATSVAYALSKRAEDDIFRENLWNMKARYAMLQFMEDYQTAFSLKDLDYIDRIFSNKAIIISGVVTGGNKRSASGSLNREGVFVDPSSFSNQKVRYTTRTKDEYLKYLRTDFKNKSFIHIVFEDTSIRWQSGVNNDVYWIELKQNYNSNRYCDVGFLTLMIDLDEIDPNIVVRTWTPEKLDLDEVMARYTHD